MKEALFNAGVVGLGGFLGALARFTVSDVIQRSFLKGLFPLGTLLVNMIGCVLIGLFLGVSDARDIFTIQVRLFVVVGVLGGFTTFSTFGHETFIMISEGDYLKATVNVMAHIVFGVALVWGGYFVTTLK